VMTRLTSLFVTVYLAVSLVCLCQYLRYLGSNSIIDINIIKDNYQSAA
jgi:hypothetical protein